MSAGISKPAGASAAAYKRLTDLHAASRANGEAADDHIPHRLEYEFAHDLSDEDPVPDDLVQGVITKGAMSVLYGDSGAGKTFLTLDLASAVALGVPWMGRQVETGLVIYLACESPASVRTRMRAYQRERGVRVPNFVIVRSPIDLFDGEADTTAVVDLVRELEQITGQKCVLIIGDTLARLSAGANENSGQDMGVVVRHVDYIRAETGAHFGLVHHCGKDQAKGARGWSGLRAATDTECEVTFDPLTGMHCMEITKQRELATRGERIGFRLSSVFMQFDKWGGARTTCVVVGTDAPPKRVKGTRPSAIEGAILEFLTARKAGCRRGELVKHFDGRYHRGSVYKEVTKMLDAAVLIESTGVVALPGEKP